MNKFAEQKKRQVQTILKFLKPAQISNPSHDSTKAPFFRGNPTEDPFLMDNKDLPKFPDTVNRHIKVLYEIIGNPDIEVYIGEWTILSLNRAVELYEKLCLDGQESVFDVQKKFLNNELNFAKKDFIFCQLLVFQFHLYKNNF